MIYLKLTFVYSKSAFCMVPNCRSLMVTRISNITKCSTTYLTLPKSFINVLSVLHLIEHLSEEK
ncbi:hypothetical protein J2S11_003769 [Bacillus horti]|uniref:Uncharacterized protein n=1 Tax=Caldalkalibacillus horti TaxID=77523 RepID=A0ABT9W3Z4_9BACI|nr:hypothetical protein [Bacillus horti]